MIKARGKFHVRKGKLKNGENVLILTGKAFMEDKEFLESISDGDEMWVADITIDTNGIRFRDCREHISPEEFLIGRCDMPNNWKEKTNF